MSEPLTTDEIAVAMETLSEWHREDGELVRVVPVDPDDREELEEAVMATAGELDHFPRIAEPPEGARFTLSTADATGITNRDIELAARIDEVVDALHDDGMT